MKVTRRKIKCRGRGCEEFLVVYGSVSHSSFMRHDYRGIATGLFCNDCYDNNYPYRKDDYSKDCCESIEGDER